MIMPHPFRLFVGKTKRFVARIPYVNKLAVHIYKRVKRLHGVYRLRNLRDIRPLRLVIGASGVHDEGWIHTDIEYLNLLDERDWEVYFQKNSVDAILAEHVWEHLTIDEGLEAAKRCLEYLSPGGGYLRVAVPDGYHPNPDYIESVRPGGCGAGAIDHKVLYNCNTLSAILEKAGFCVVLLEWYDSRHRLHCVRWSGKDGMIWRSLRYDKRNTDGVPRYTSLIVDAYKNP